MSGFMYPSDDELRELYNAAKEFKNEKPWETLFDSNIFCIVDPETKTKVYCSILGNNGEFFGICGYIGNEGLMILDAILRQSVETDEALMLQNSILCSFENRQYLSKRDMNDIKRLGLRFRGSNEWPSFRRYLPGYAGWYLCAQECRLMTCILKQSVIVYKEHISGKKTIDPSGRKLITRSRREKDDGYIWSSRESDLRIPVVSYKDIKLEDNDFFRELNRTKRRSNTIYQIECRHVNLPIQKNNNERPYYPKMFFVLEQDTKCVIEHYLFDQNDNEIKIIFEKLSLLLTKYGLPVRIKVGNERMKSVLSEFCTKTGIMLEERNDLPDIDKLIFEMTKKLNRGMSDSF